MTNYISLSTVDQANLDVYMETVHKLDPELYYISLALNETGVNPLLIPQVIRALYNLAIGTGYGTITFEVQNGKLTNFLIKESDQNEINKDILI
jgi:hypothetical protein